MTTFQYSIEILLCALLLMGIVYSIHLGRALAVLRRDRRELADLVARLDESGRRAEDGVEKLQTAADVSGRSLGRMIDQSKMLKHELEALSERADAMAERLEGLLREGNRAMPEKQTPFAAVVGDKSVNDEMPVEVEDVRNPLASLPASPPNGGSRPYETRARQKTAAEQDLIRALRMS